MEDVDPFPDLQNIVIGGLRDACHLPAVGRDLYARTKDDPDTIMRIIAALTGTNDKLLARNNLKSLVISDPRLDQGVVNSDQYKQYDFKGLLLYPYRNITSLSLSTRGYLSFKEPTDYLIEQLPDLRKLKVFCDSVSSSTLLTRQLAMSRNDFKLHHLEFYGTVSYAGKGINKIEHKNVQGWRCPRHIGITMEHLSQIIDKSKLLKKLVLAQVGLHESPDDHPFARHADFLDKLRGLSGKEEEGLGCTFEDVPEFDRSGTIGQRRWLAFLVHEYANGRGSGNNPLRGLEHPLLSDGYEGKEPVPSSNGKQRPRVFPRCRREWLWWPAVYGDVALPQAFKELIFWTRLYPMDRQFEDMRDRLLQTNASEIFGDRIA